MARLLVLALLAAGVAQADEPAMTAVRSVDRSTVDGQAGADAQGVVSLNMAAGVGNVQANVRAIALGPDAGAAASVGQSIDANGADAGRDARAVFAGAAFSAPRGVIGLNQAAGAANAQANILAIAPAAMAGYAQQIDNLALAATRADPADATGGATAVAPIREARIEAGALRAPSGILQLNQSAGAGNASVNAIVLQLPGGTP
ncbi:hypothetical protein [Lysobacter humi (ex Lee et al. 2017)]